MEQTVKPREEKPAGEPSDSSVLRVVTASFIGTAIEWYDFFLYGTAAALVFPTLFFPKADERVGVMASFATYAVGFFARPVGGVVFGHFGDRMGRKSMLVTTLMMMGVATFLIGVLPTYDQVGLLAPIALVALRFVQGFGVGGEWGGAVLMAVEHGHRGRRGLYASWVQAGAPAGMLIAAGVFSLCKLLPQEAFLAWGWRIPFLLGLALLLVGMFIRLRVMESPIFARLLAAKRPERLPILSVIVRYPGSVMLAMGARFAENACYYIFTVFVLTYVKQQLKLPEQAALHGVLLASAIHFLVIPVFGLISDRVGRRPVYIAGAALLALYAFPFFWLVDTRQTPLIWLAIAGALLIHALMYAPQAAFISELFGAEVRYSGASIGAQLAAPLAGGLAPLIAVALLQKSNGEPWPVAVYLIGVAAITLLSVWLAAETHRVDLDRH
jgi:metabolite-proton symporter